MGIQRELSQKFNMTSLERDNEDCNCNVVVLEQSHCNLVHLIVLDLLIDSLDKITSSDDDSMTRKPHSRLLELDASCEHLPRMEGQLRWHHFRPRDKELAETVRNASTGT